MKRSLSLRLAVLATLPALAAACGGPIVITDDAESGGSGPAGGTGPAMGGAGPNSGGAGTGSGTSSGGAAHNGGGPGAGGSVGPGPSGGSNGLGGSLGAGGGGEPGAGGAPGTGGSPPIPEPSLVTSGSGDYWKVGEVTEGGTTANVTVNDSDLKQDWLGFGGTVNEKGWEVLLALSEADRALALRLLFDKNEGAGFSYGRIPIGASDYAKDRYTLNETDNDYEMANFSIERDKQLLIPYIQAAIAVKGDIKWWASPWTPPTWMKSNNAFDKGSMKSDAQTLGAHALYLHKFVDAYKAEGINVFAVHPQNEPGFEQDYPSCAWSGDTMKNYISTYLGPELEGTGIEIWLGTLSNSTADDTVGTATLNDAGAKKYIKGVGLQWGMIDKIGNYTGKGVPVMQSEHKCGNYPWLGGFVSGQAPNDQAYGEESWDLIKSWIEKGVSIYSAWNMVLDTKGFNMDTVRPWPQNALLTVDTSSKKLTLTPAYYVFRHVAQYVDPGAKRVGVSGGNALAFKNPDGDIVTILFNSGQSAAQTTLSVGGKMLQFSIPGRGWATVNHKAE
jgi:glucosylceramidase